MRALVVATILAGSHLPAQTSQVPYDSLNGGPTLTSSLSNYVDRKIYPSIRSIDFRNFAFPIFDEAGRQIGRSTLKNGKREHKDRDTYESEELEAVHYLRRSSGTPDGDSVLLLFSWFAAGGSSSQGGSASVLTLQHGHLRLVQSMEWDTHFSTKEPTDSFEADKNTLVVRTAHYIPGDAHCCVSAMDVITLQWDGIHFIQTGITTELSDYGKTEGKELPH